MTVISVEPDVDTVSLTVVAEFAAPIEKVWELWANPRLLERWWGPPSYPATFETHDLTPGGDATYFMTGPEGDRPHGWWRVVSVNPPKSLEFIDGFADEHGHPLDDMPTISVRVDLTEDGGRTRLVTRSTFDSREQMDQLVNMGMVEGFREAAGQMDAVLLAA